MFHNKALARRVGFWSVLFLAVTAEGWMDLLCRLLFP